MNNQDFKDRGRAGTQVMPQMAPAPVGNPGTPPGPGASWPLASFAPTAGIRGVIIKVPDASPGLLVIQGGQRPFVVDGTWRSPVAPSINQAVDVQLEADGRLAAVVVVDERQLARERMQQLGGAAQVHGAQAATLARAGVMSLAQRMGKVPLGAGLLLWVAFFLLPAVSVSLFVATTSFTLWDFLGVDIGSFGLVPSHGPFAWLGLAAIAAPFVAPFLQQPRARLLYAAPAAFAVVTVARVYFAINDALGGVDKATRTLGAGFGGAVAKAESSMMSSALSMFSVGVGTYAFVLAAMVLAAFAVRGKPHSARIG